MSSMKSLMLESPAAPAPDAFAAMFDAVRSVAERSFFSVAEPQDARTFREQAARLSEWLVATVQFDQRTLGGSISCSLPRALADGLFDAFTGRDPVDPPPSAAMVRDLMGEFSNMVCGVWLTRVACGRSFTLTHPMVRAAGGPGRVGNLRTVAAINDLPMAFDLYLRTQDLPEA